ncbi:MAG: glycoside hydrolase family 88 protein [Acidobacteriota bacterium]
MLAAFGETARFPFVAFPDRVESVDAADWLGHPGNWTAGFWPGMLWLAWRWTGETRYAERAHQACGLLRARLDWKRHDLGFLFYPSCAAGARLTGDPRLTETALTAAENMLRLWDPAVGMVPIGPVPGEVQVAVDTLAALELLTWASEETGDPRFEHVALQHFRRSMDLLVRPDGSTFHAARLESGSGRLLWRGTWQGFRDDSCWSRGQAWAMYGASLLLGKAGLEFPAAADRLFDFWERHTGEDILPPWDFHPDATPVADSSAAAVAAAALVRHRDPRRRLQGKQLLELLATVALTGDSSAEAGLLRHGCSHFPRAQGVDCCTIWGDFYFMAAVDAITEREEAEAAAGPSRRLSDRSETSPTD